MDQSIGFSPRQVEVDLGTEMTLTGLALQGAVRDEKQNGLHHLMNPRLKPSQRACWVTRFRIEISEDGKHWWCVLDEHDQIKVNL